MVSDTLLQLAVSVFSKLHLIQIPDSNDKLVLDRYNHFNPVTSFLIQEEKLDSYPWSSLPEYLETRADGICDHSFIKSFFPKINDYLSFVHDQIGYARELEKIKHLSFEEKS